MVSRLSVVLVISWLLQAQQPPPTFHAGLNLVEVDVRVFNRSGQFVTDLVRDDFRVFEDGRPQEISAFTLIDLSAASRATTDRPLENVGRYYVLVLDDLHTHPLRAAASRAIARQFIERWLGETDKAAVVVTGGGTPYQDMTAERRALLAAIDGFRGHRLPAAPIPVPPGLPPPLISSLPAIGREEPATNARTMLRTLRRIAESLPSLDGRRKAIILISEGIDYDLTQFDDRNADAILQDSRDTAATAIRNNVGIYAVDPRGLPTGPRGAIQPTALADEDYLSAATVRAHQGLYALADETGGFALLKSNDIAPVFDRIVNDSSRYYLLGYSPPNPGTARYRRIRVDVKRSDATVRARPGYYVR